MSLNGSAPLHFKGKPPQLFSRSQDRLQKAIQEKERELRQLYEIRGAQFAKEPQATEGGPIGSFQTHELRIRGDGSPTTPPLEVRTPESVAAGLTAEARHLDTATASQPARQRFSMRLDRLSFENNLRGGTCNHAAVPTEFTARLQRLTGARQEKPTRSVPTAVRESGSLNCSPIPLQRKSGDCSYSFEADNTVFQNLFEESVKTSSIRNSAGDSTPRHVRFSSRSPQVSTFSVERSCPRTGQPTNFVRAAERPSHHGAIGSDMRVDVVESAAAASSPEARQQGIRETSVSWQGESTPGVSRISTALSPRSSVASYLEALRALRCSLLESGTPSTRHSGGKRCVDADSDLSAAPHRTSILSQRHNNTATIAAAAAAAAEHDDVEAATPTKAVKTENSSNGVDNHNAFSPFVQSVNGTVSSPSPQPDSIRSCAQKEEEERSMEKCSLLMTSDSPIFLPRRERQQNDGVTITVAASPVQAEQGVTRDARVAYPEQSDRSIAASTRNPSSRSPSTSHSRTRTCLLNAGKKPPLQPASGKRTKTVRFCPDVKDTDDCCDAPKAVPVRRKRTSHQKASLASALVHVPSNMCVEQKGFGAGISLACGPTLHFD